MMAGGFTTVEPKNLVATGYIAKKNYLDLENFDLHNIKYSNV